MPRKVLSRRIVTSSPAEEPEEIEVPVASQTDMPASKKINPFAAALLIIIVLVAGGLFVKNTLAAKKVAEKSTPTEQAEPAKKDEVQETIRRVAKHIKVKTDEVPTVATVQDADLLRKNNPIFYQYAQSGDRLVIWSDKAILYSPTEDILLSVMPVTVNPSEVKTETAPQEQATPKEQAVIEVRNGSGVAGLGKAVTEKLKEVHLEVLPPGDAKSKLGYPKTIMIIKPGKEIPNIVKEIQQVTGAEISTALNEDETAMKGDVLVILGSDKK
ncbi:LytR C-terminal domain-containing protein [Candidatus Uhrbacteria bacterium]|nr:LytR C-terminal domain-containing protein [Candidatus Uhrbacteria bacterium]